MTTLSSSTDALPGLAGIAPTRGAKYSPNLYAFLASQSDAFRRLCRVFRAEGPSFWIGFHDGEQFIGANLNTVLLQGEAAQLMAFKRVAGRLQELPGFWASYASVGRCALDAGHEMSFIGDDTRYSLQGDARVCTWCKNVTQVLRRWTETQTVERAAWVKA